MDIMDDTDASLRLIKGFQRLLRDWKLIILMLFQLTSNAVLADSSDQLETVTKCPGDNASFTWDYEVQPFFAIEWFFENTQIAETSEPSFSLDVLHINKMYSRRFVLQSPGNVGFNITNVTKNDEGDYRCIVTLKSTHIPKALKKKLRVEEYSTTTTSTHASSTKIIPEETVPNPQPNDVIIIGIGISIGIIIVVIIIIAIIVYRRKRNTPCPRKEQPGPKRENNLLNCQFKRSSHTTADTSSDDET